MMIKFLNRANGAEMWVDASRFQEYLDRGHKPAVQVPEAPKVEPVRKVTRKAKK